MKPDDSWTDLINIVAHDLKAPIGAVRGFLELTHASGSLNDDQTHYLEQARSGLNRMEKLINRMLDFAWIDAGKPLDLVTCDPTSIIFEAVSLLKPTAARLSVTIHIDLAPDLGNILGDPHRLEQVISNLLSNAIKYHSEGGDIWITAIGSSENVTITVRDNGQGIHKFDQPRVFERFFRAQSSLDRKIEGTGLGLSIAKAIVERHQGRIWLDSTPGKGAAFTFVLPRRPTVSEGHSGEHEPMRSLGELAESPDPFRHYSPGEELDVTVDDTQESQDLGLARDDED